MSPMSPAHWRSLLRGTGWTPTHGVPERGSGAGSERTCRPSSLERRLPVLVDPVPCEVAPKNCFELFRMSPVGTFSVRTTPLVRSSWRTPRYNANNCGIVCCPRSGTMLVTLECSRRATHVDQGAGDGGPLPPNAGYEWRQSPCDVT